MRRFSAPQPPKAILNLTVRIVNENFDEPLDESGRLGELARALNGRVYKSGLKDKVRAKTRAYVEGERHITLSGFLRPGHVEGVPTTDGVLELWEIRPHNNFHLHSTEYGILDFKYGRISKTDRENLRLDV